MSSRFGPRSSSFYQVEHGSYLGTRFQREVAQLLRTPSVHSSCGLFCLLKGIIDPLTREVLDSEWSRLKNVPAIGLHKIFDAGVNASFHAFMDRFPGSFDDGVNFSRITGDLSFPSTVWSVFVTFHSNEWLCTLLANFTTYMLGAMLLATVPLLFLLRHLLSQPVVLLACYLQVFFRRSLKLGHVHNVSGITLLDPSHQVAHFFGLPSYFLHGLLYFALHVISLPFVLCCLGHLLPYRLFHLLRLTICHLRFPGSDLRLFYIELDGSIIDLQILIISMSIVFQLNVGLHPLRNVVQLVA